MTTARTHEAAVMLCTWDAACPQHAERRMERQDRPGLTSVESVCDRHVEAAHDAGYELRESGDRRVSPNPDLTRDPPPG